MLLEKGADVNAQGGLYGTALQMAIAAPEGKEEIVAMLLEKGADVNAQDGLYGTALQMAIAAFPGEDKKDKIVAMLLEKGADVNAQGGLYGTALQAAAIRGMEEIVAMLLEKGADVNAQGGAFGTVLQAAARKGKDKILASLIDKIAFGATLETAAILVAANKKQVVPRASAVVPGLEDAEPIVIHADHTNMVRSTSRGDSGYNTISEHFQIMARAAPEEIRRRWESEKRVDEARLGGTGAAFVVDFSLSEISEVHHFVAREEELAGIYKLAAAYAKRHREDYSAECWLNAREETSLMQGSVRAADRILRDHTSVVYIRNAVESRDLNEAVQAVKRWLDNHKNGR
ncbi:hypothetical protein VTI74DRAFT_1646 [Chaetomium olivicolor]